MWAYLLINLLTVLVPLVRSFEPRIAFYKQWKPLFLAILLTGMFFIAWDGIFTAMGVWGFNRRYVLGPHLLGLPLEEWLFFVTVPYACVFMYAVLNHFLKRELPGRVTRVAAVGLALVALGFAGVNHDRWYTVTTCGLSAALLLLHVFVWKSAWLGRFLRAYVVCLVPFFIVNGVLTGTGIEGEVVWYNDAENIGWRMGTIPFEDVFYGLDLLLMNVGWYEYWRGRLRAGDGAL